MCINGETTMNHIEYLRIYADSEGCSHFEIKNMDFETLKNKRQKNIQEQIFIRYYEQVVIDSPISPTLTVDNGSQS
jgi:hypothetical protein